MKRFIDKDYVTCAEYQLFINDALKDNATRYHQPDHWDKEHFPKGFSSKPVLGIRFDDANLYCKWLTKQQKEIGTKYRLPSPAEAQSVNIEGDIGCWCQQGD